MIKIPGIKTGNKKGGKMDFRDQLLQIGIDADSTITRFGGNEALLVRFIKKFTEDPTFLQIQKAAEEKDFAGLERSAHTLKGTSANLGFNRLCSLCSDMVQKLRAGEKDEVAGLFCQIEQEYGRIIEWIHNLDQ